MYTLLKPFQVQIKLLEKKISFFTADEFSQIFKLPDYKSKYFLEKWVNEGFLVRLKNGLYSIKARIPSEEEIANRLYQPSYISFEYALAYYNIMPEMVYRVTSATTKPTRIFDIESKSFEYLKIKKEAYTGYGLVQIGEKSYLMAEPEKALVDYLYFVVLGKKTLNDRLILDNLNKNKVLAYAKLYKRLKLEGLIKGLI